MDINHMILVRRIEELRSSLDALTHEMKNNPDEEAEGLRTFVHLKTEELDMLVAAVDQLNYDSLTKSREKVTENFKQLRNDVCQATMQWKRILSKQNRAKKNDQLLAS